MKRFKRLFTGTSAAVLTLSSLLSIGFTGVAHAAVQTCDWIGGTDLKFSTAANWSNCGGSTPLAGDIIRFDNASVPTQPAYPTPPIVLTNDLNVAFGGVETYFSTASGQTQMYVDTLQLADGGYFDATAATSLTGQLSLEIGTVKSGNTYVSEGVLNNLGSVNLKSSGLLFTNMATTTTNMTITLGDGVYLSSNQVGLGATGDVLVLQNGSSFYTYPYQATTTNSYAIVAGGGTGTKAPEIYVYDYDKYDSASQTSTYLASETDFSGALTLNNDLNVLAGSMTTLTTVKFTGTVSGTGAITRDQNSTGVLITPSGALVNPVTVTALDGVVSGYGVTGAYAIVNQNETATLNGTRDSILVKPAGTLKGTGIVKNSLYVSNGGHVAPGNSPGCLTVGTLDLAGEYQFDLGGTDPCTGYDQIKVTDTTAGDKSTTIETATATLTTSRYNNYTPKKGQVFIIIDNQGPDPVVGTFMGLPEGATFTQNGIIFKISYVGGTGNDVTLTVQNVPTAPDTGFAFVSANPMMSLALMAGAAGALMVVARRIRPAHAVAHKSSRRK